ncbi:class I SAM-dependent methyltransferase [Gammaproteobacteria bacterium]|nr:class I SAM-dependent methyltransferase [Gammaproteobacteria bacterium]
MSNIDPFPIEAFSKLFEAEEKHWWFVARNRIILWVMDVCLPSFNNFLEIGCGTGFVLNAVNKKFPRTELFGAEFYEEGLIYARLRVPQAKFSQLDAQLLDDVEMYDCVGAFDVLEHIENDELVLRNIYRALNPSGFLVMTVPQHKWLWSAVDSHAGHQRRYTKKELIDATEAAGFQVEHVMSFVSMLLPLMWAARVLKRHEIGDDMAEMEISNRLNTALGWMMKAEFFLLKHGLRLPFGGSLLVVARRV